MVVGEAKLIAIDRAGHRQASSGYVTPRYGQGFKIRFDGLFRACVVLGGEYLHLVQLVVTP